MFVSEVDACSFDKWYPTFEKVTFRSVVIPIPPEVLTYLRSDGSLVLPVECDEKRLVPDNNETDDEESSSTEWSDEEIDANEDRPSFPEFHRILTESIDALGGHVFTKLNWSSPKDAAWIGFGSSLKCSTPGQVWLLLKSSDFISHDLTQPYKDTEDILTLEEFQEPRYTLVLRRWVDINPGFEFRCFVKSQKLVAIAQRDQTQYYRHISQDRSTIVRDISTFFSEYIKDKFELQSFVFDVIRFGKDRVKLVDFNPFGITTDPIMFLWEELENLDPNEDDIDFRYVSTDCGIQPSVTRHYSLPKDIVDLADGSDHQKMVDFIKLQTTMQEKESSGLNLKPN